MNWRLNSGECTDKTSITNEQSSIAKYENRALQIEQQVYICFI